VGTTEGAHAEELNVVPPQILHSSYPAGHGKQLLDTPIALQLVTTGEKQPII